MVSISQASFRTRIRNFFYKGSESKYIGFGGHVKSVAPTKLCGCWNESSHRISKRMDIAVSQLNLIYKTGGGSDLACESKFANP